MVKQLYWFDNKFSFYKLLAPQEQKIKAEGQTTYPFESFWKDFGIHYRKLDLEDRISFCSLVSDCYKLETHEKRKACKINLSI